MCRGRPTLHNVIGKPQIVNSSAACAPLPIMFFKASDIILLKKKWRGWVRKKHYCLTPTVVLNHSPMLPFIKTALITLSYRCSMARTRFAMILYFRMVAHNAAWHTLLFFLIFYYYFFFELYEDLVQVLLILKVFFHTGFRR